MKLALRQSLPPRAALTQRASAAAIEARLVTQFAHGGILIGDTLHHATGARGVHAEEGADLTGWTLIDLGTEHDARALDLFESVEGAGYDWVSLLAFVVAPATDRHRWYCFELCWLLMTSTAPRERVTAEMLIVRAMQMGGRLITLPPAVKTLEFAHA